MNKCHRSITCLCWFKPAGWGAGVGVLAVKVWTEVRSTMDQSFLRKEERCDPKEVFKYGSSRGAREAMLNLQCED